MPKVEGGMNPALCGTDRVLLGIVFEVIKFMLLPVGVLRQSYGSCGGEMNGW
jgi:hypothetical protein